MALYDLIAKGTYQSPVESYRKGLQDMMTEQVRGHQLRALQRAEDKELGQEQIRQELLGAKTPDERNAIFKKANDMGYGQMVLDNYKVIQTMKNAEIQEQNYNNDLIGRYIGAIRKGEQTGNLAMSKQAYQEVRKFAVETLKYNPERLPETYEEAKRLGVIDREEVLHLTTKEQFNRQMQRKRLDIESAKARETKRYHNAVIENQRTRNKIAGVNATTKLLKAQKGKDYKPRKPNREELKIASGAIDELITRANELGLNKGRVPWVGGAFSDFYNMGEQDKQKAAQDYSMTYDQAVQKYKDPRLARKIAEANFIKNFGTNKNGKGFMNYSHYAKDSSPGYSEVFLKLFRIGKVSEVDGSSLAVDYTKMRPDGSPSILVVSKDGKAVHFDPKKHLKHAKALKSLGFEYK